MITEMIDKLVAEAAEEADHKAWCDKETMETQEKIDYHTRKARHFLPKWAQEIVLFHEFFIVRLKSRRALALEVVYFSSPVP